MAKTVSLSINVIFFGLVGGLAIIIIVGLSSGLAGRKNNCIKQNITSSTQTPSSSTLPPIDPTPTGPTRTIPTGPSRSTVIVTTNPPSDVDRLPEYIQPSNYKLLMKAFFDPNDAGNGEPERFDALIEIKLRITTENQRRILFHMDPSLKIEGLVELHEGDTNGQALILTASQQLQMQFYELVTASALKTGTDYIIKIAYSGDYGAETNINAFYMSRYSEDGKTKKTVSTKFQPTDARRAYPCFDEPGFKATYDITIEHPINSIALSNWPINGSPTSIGNNRLRSVFATTVPMSSYLAAWAVLPNDYGFKETTSENNKPIRVWARKDAVNAGLIDFAVDVTKRSLDYFENVYFKISDAVPPKIDLLAFPQFPSGAMEHWGLIGFRETTLLFSDKTNSVENKQSVAYVIAHELAHFWFGNLVTCRWWDDLWLNEGMARFLQFKAIDYLYPDWRVNDQFLTSYEIPVMFQDSFENTNPVSIDVNTPDQINSVFNSITYDKGSSLLRMLESTVGPANFQQALQSFLNANKFNVADANTFYNTLKMPDIMGSTTARTFMENWLLQINFPIVTITLQGNQVKFVQNRFVQKGDENLTATSPFNFNWLIYMKCVAGGQNGLVAQTFDFYLPSKEGTFNLNANYVWVMCNKDFSGYYLNEYSIAVNEFHGAALASQNSFSVADKAFLLHNGFALSFNGKQTYGVPSYLVQYLESNERENVPWRTFTWHMNKLASLLEHRSAFTGISDYARTLSKSVLQFTDIWSDSGSHSEKLLKINIANFLCRMQDSECLRNATRLFDTIDSQYFTNPSNLALNPIPANLRSASYRYHTQNSYNKQDYFDLVTLYERTSDSQEKSIVLSAMSYSRSLWFLDYLFDSLLSPNPLVKAQDFFSLVVSISRNPTGRHYAWYFIKGNWDEIVAKFGLGSRTLGNAVKSVCETFDTPFLLLEMRDLFDYTYPGAGESARKSVLEQVKYNIVWMRDRLVDAEEHLTGPAKK